MSVGAGLCKWPYAIVDGVRTHISNAARLQHGLCPVCGAELVARKGRFREDHWWHVNGARCDPWYQPKGPWHRYWQNMFPKECQEVVVEGDVDGVRVRHIADVKTPGGVVMEVQYSAITPDTVKIREAFYGKMIWLASMRRVESDMTVLTALKRNGPYPVEGESAWVIEDPRLAGNQKWFLASKPVAFDFAGWFDKPESDEHLYCLLPTFTGGPERVCIEVDRYKLMEALRNSTCGRLLRQWKDAVPDIIRRYNVSVEERKRQAEAEAKAAREQQRKFWHERIAEASRKRQMLGASNARDMSFYQDVGLTPEEVHDFITGQFSSELSLALSLGWVEAYLVCCGEIVHNTQVPISAFAVPKMGRFVLHYVNGYTYEEFKRDAAKAKECLGEEISKALDFEKMKKLQGKVVAVGDYFACGENGSEGVLFRGVRYLRRHFDLHAQKVGFSRISKKQSAFFSAYDSPFGL